MLETKNLANYTSDNNDQPPSYDPAPAPSSNSTSIPTPAPMSSSSIFSSIFNSINTPSTPAPTHPLHPSETSITPLPLVLPADHATGAEVRAYIRSFLYHNSVKYDVDPTEAVAGVAAIAAKWQYGSGVELRTSSMVTWWDLFGQELGTVLYNDVQRKVVLENREKGMDDYTVNNVWFAVSITWLITLLIIGSLPAIATAPDAWWTDIALALLALPAVCLGIVLNMAFVLRKMRWNKEKKERMGGRRGEGYVRVQDEEQGTELYDAEG